MSEIHYNRNCVPDLPSLEQEESRGLDIGVEYFGNNGLHLEAVVFDQRIDNEMYFDMVGFTGYVQSDLRNESRGLELIGALRVSERVRSNATYTCKDPNTTDA